MNASTENVAPVSATAGNGVAIGALVTGLAGLVLALIFFFSDVAGPGLLISGSILGLVGIVLGIIGLKKHQSKAMSVVGLIAGIVTILASVGIFIFALVFLGALFAG